MAGLKVIMVARTLEIKSGTHLLTIQEFRNGLLLDGGLRCVHILSGVVSVIMLASR